MQVHSRYTYLPVYYACIARGLKMTDTRIDFNESSTYASTSLKKKFLRNIYTCIYRYLQIRAYSDWNRSERELIFQYSSQPVNEIYIEREINKRE